MAIFKLVRVGGSERCKINRQNCVKKPSSYLLDYRLSSGWPPTGSRVKIFFFVTFPGGGGNVIMPNIACMIVAIIWFEASPLIRAQSNRYIRYYRGSRVRSNRYIRYYRGLRVQFKRYIRYYRVSRVRSNRYIRYYRGSRDRSN